MMDDITFIKDALGGDDGQASLVSSQDPRAGDAGKKGILRDKRPPTGKGITQSMREGR